MDSMSNGIVKIFKELTPRQLKSKRIDLNTNFRQELGFDSITLFNLIYKMELDLGIDLYSMMDQLAAANTILDVVNLSHNAKQPCKAL